uniref:aralkylamine N-acetyltransferase n=1 Tax=Syphacia muris TaxID=451379 RepID=A0A0N5AZI2_9BILA
MANGADQLTFRYFNESDFKPVMQFIINNFIRTEPLAVSIGFQEADAWTITADTVREALPDGYCCGYENPNKEIVAVRICQPVNRPTTAERCDESNNECQNLSKAARTISLVLDTLEKQIWHKVDPSITRLFTIHIICTNNDYRRKGLCYKLMNMDIEKQKSDGIQGMYTEATAFNSQRLFHKMGCTVLAQVDYSSVKDESGKALIGTVTGTDCAQLFYKKY